MNRQTLLHISVVGVLWLTLLLTACGQARDNPTHTPAPNPTSRIEKETVVQEGETVVQEKTVVETVVEVVTATPGGPRVLSAQPLPEPAPLPQATAYPDQSFQDYGTNPFISAEHDALSTFALDVDTGSYTLMRRYMREGLLPPEDSVRVEEYVNYFDQGYAPPGQGAFAIHLDGATSPFGQADHYLLRVGIQGYQVPEAQRPDASLVFVIDVSGSMGQENRLELVKQALHVLVGELRPTDQVGIVVYSTQARVLLESTPASQAETILNAIDRLYPENSTNLEHGLMLGYDMAARHFKPRGINRLVLCSDGVANEGNTKAEAILARVSEHLDQGITLSTVGFGMENYNDVLMEQLADQGNGNYAYVDDLGEASRVFRQNLSGTLQVIAKDAKVQVEFNPRVVSHYRLLGYENREVADADFRNDQVDAGEIGAGHSVTALYEVGFQPEARGLALTVYLRYQHPDTGAVQEISQSLDQIHFQTAFADMPPRFRLAGTVAAYAELLRHGYWNSASDLETIVQAARELGADLAGDPDVLEFSSFVMQTEQIAISEQNRQRFNEHIAQPDVRTLVICMGQEPSSLYLYGDDSRAARNVREAIYDGPINSRNYGYQPVILEKLPSLADGDARIQSVNVRAGDRVMNAAGEPVTLEPGVSLRPTGCYASDCAVTFNGPPVQMEQLLVSFRLRSDIAWSNGQRLTAHDSVYSYELARDPDTPADKFAVERTASYQAQDDYTTVWTGLPGYRDPTYMTNFWSPLPEHLWRDLSPQALLNVSQSTRLPVGWGPYIAVEWTRGDHISLTRNPNYWRAQQELPRFDTIVFRFIGQQPNASIAAVLSGDCDVLTSDIDLSDQAELLIELEAAGEITPLFAPNTVWEHLDFGINPAEGYQRPDLFQDPRTRRAIATCLDTPAVINSVLYGRSNQTFSYVPPSHPLYDANVPTWSYDPQAAKDLLAEVGWIDADEDGVREAHGVAGVPDGTRLAFTWTARDSEFHKVYMQRYQQNLSECGVDVRLETLPADELFADGPQGPLFGRRFDVGSFAWQTGVEPPCSLYLSSQVPGRENGWTGRNVSGFSDAEFDEACAAASQFLPGTPEYERYHHQAQRILAEQLPVVPLFQFLEVAATAPGITGFILDPSAGSDLWNIEAFDY